MTIDNSIRSDWATFTAAVPTPGTVTVEEMGQPPLTALELDILVKKWLKHGSHWSEGTRILYERCLRQFQVALGQNPYTYDNAIAAFDKMSEKQSAHRRGSNRRILISWEGFCRKIGYPQVGWISTIRPPKEMPKTRRVIPYDEFKLLLADSRSEEQTLTLHLLWMTGLSLVDVDLLQWKNVNMDQLVITINRKKTSKACVVPIIEGSGLHATLQKHYRDRLSSVGQNPSVNGAHYVMNRYASARLRGKTIFPYNLKQSCIRLGLPEIFAHDFRATFCSAAMAVGDSVTACFVTGHSDPKTFKNYATPDLRTLRSLVEKAQLWSEENDHHANPNV